MTIATHYYAPVGGSSDRRRVVDRPIVDDDHFEVYEMLSENGAQCALEESRTIVAGHHHRGKGRVAHA